VGKFKVASTLLVFFLAVGVGIGLHRLEADTIPAKKVESPQVAGPDGRFETKIRTPKGPPTVATGVFDARGESVQIACSTCHATLPPDLRNRSGEDMDQFHQGLQFKHGSSSCLSCHNANNYDTLRLSDGTSLPYANVMKLCGQCHGPQHRDYQNGAHGGMNGYWDLSKGGRQRNNCIDCHNPHVPKIQPVLPAAGPRDRAPASH
jgi:hypothetical protein